jgi:hypothetical protein
MQRILLLHLVLVGYGISHSKAQSVQENAKYWVFLSDKNNSEFDPYTYFDQKAINRRNKLGISLYDSSDFPVNETYTATITAMVDSVAVISRWFNALVLHANEKQIQSVASLGFVDSVIKASPITKHISGEAGDLVSGFEISKSQIGLAKAQVQRMGAKDFQAKGLTGKGIRIAVFDIGFKSYKTNPAFNHIRTNSKIISTWDFVKNRKNVDAGGTHGTNVLSCIAGKDGNQIIGLAQDAEFLLARTETWTEFFAEEENWLAAAEWADKHGADIINSSLGYTYHRYFRYDMDGKTAFVSRAANLAAHKGILVVNAAGNEGTDSWKNIGAPADADSVLSVGGIHNRTGIHTDFSSFGPTWDKRLKPNVSAFGHVVAAGPKGYHKTQGTSFSSPLIAGFAACAWQSDTSLSNMEMFRLIQRSADLYPYYDYAHGYGVPQANYFTVDDESPETEPSIMFEKGEHWVRIKFTDSTAMGSAYQDLHGMNKSVPDHVYYHIENKHGYLSKYYVVSGSASDHSQETLDEFVINHNSFEKPFTIRAFHLGTVIEHIVE